MKSITYKTYALFTKIAYRTDDEMIHQNKINRPKSANGGKINCD